MQRTQRTDGIMTPEQRRAEVTEILAVAVVRLRIRAALPCLPKSPESAANCLEVPSETRLSVHAG
jgi:hypothetical protein